MKWQLSVQAVFMTDDMMPVAIPADGLQPYIQFDDLDDLVDFLKAVGRVAGDEEGVFEEYADRLDQEGEVMEPVAARSQGKESAKLQKALARAVRRELPPVEGGLGNRSLKQQPEI